MKNVLFHVYFVLLNHNLRRRIHKFIHEIYLNIHEVLQNFEFKEAKEDFQSAIELDPNFILAHINLFREKTSNTDWIDLSDKDIDLIETMIPNGTDYEKLLEVYKRLHFNNDLYFSFCTTYLFRQYCQGLFEYNPCHYFLTAYNIYIYRILEQI